MTSPARPLHLSIVTGSSRGLGAALVARLLAADHRVLGLARRRNPALDALASARGAALEQWTLDLADAVGAAERLAQWLNSLSPREVASATLINNAGLLGRAAPLAEVPPATLSLALRAGLEAALLLTAVFLDGTRDWPVPRRVMNISSGLGRRAMAGSAAYCAAKAGMDHFSRCVALEEAARPHGARIVSIAPGVIDTDMQAELRGADAALFPERTRFAQLHAEGALLSADDCAARLLARLAREDFGTEPVADIRSA
jgi:NAD(P)-dependent dehydrogenase (short-subunit alcohol dehydrogenase family)